jgi:uncharacterized repeat protein (TIGR02543 family)
MATFKCKMCGGDLDPKEGESVVTCPFCGTKQTIASNDSEKKTNLFNRANALRLRNEFDKALLAYQAILAEFPDEAEAYWGIVLCRYGIEYVDDPATKKKKPTMHRASFESIVQDVDYKNALAKADVVARQEYQVEGEEIAAIQKNILAISQKEDPFDVFICYKESDDSGKRTKDSVLAQQIYDELTEKGYKVFFSRVTLEKKIGVLYEPYIFAALNSAKIMLVVGTKAEYFNAVWVKNEWSRFISLMSSHGDRYLIPCYGEMNAYDLPEEMLNFQAQDLSKLGFMQDLLRGIDKLMGRDAPKVETKEKTTIIQSDVNIPSLLKRSEILIGDGNYEKADSLLEKILDNDPTNSQAYLYKLLEDLQLRHVDELEAQTKPLDGQDNFQKAYEFGDSEQKKRLDALNQAIKDRIEEERLNGLYASALALKEAKRWADAEKAFSDIAGYRDAKEQAEECVKLGTQDVYNRAIELKNSGEYDQAIDLFTKVLTFQDSEDQIEACEKEKEEARKEGIYKAAVITREIRPYFDLDALADSIGKLKGISGYKDADALTAKYQKIIDDYALERQKKAEEAANAAKLKKAKRNRFLRIFIPSLLGFVGILLFVFLWLTPTIKVNKAVDTINSGDYDTALKQLDGTGSFGDTENLKQMCYAGKAFKSLDYETGIDKIYAIGGTTDIAFDGNGGTPDQSSQTIKKQKYVTSSSNKDGYTFYGWVLTGYTLDAKGHQASLSLKASYEPITYTITYEMNGIDQPAALPTSYNIETGVVIPNVERYGYTFLGWSGTDLTTPTKDYTIAPGVIGNKTFAAHWKANDYVLHLDAAGGIVDSASIKVTFDSAYALPTPTYAGYDFLGWFDSNEVSYNSGTWTQAHDVYLTAHWNLHDYAISYALQGGTNAAANPATYTVTSDDIVLADPSKTGYSFTGWTNANVSTPTKGLTIKKGSVGDLSFTANWSANTYVVNYDAGEGTVDHATDSFVYDADYALPTPTRTGYAFAGWLNGTDPVAQTGKWAIAQNVTLTANWSARNDIAYVVNYYGQNVGDDNYTLMESVPCLGSADQNVTLNAKTYTGFTPKEASLSKTISPDGTTTIDFYYTRNTYTLSFVANGGDAVADLTLRYQQSIPTATVATRSGYTFGGWFDSYDQSQEFASMPATNCKAYAWWSEEAKACRFSVSFANDEATLNVSNGLSGKVVAPAYVNGCPVVALGVNTFANNADITDIVLPTTVTSIGNASFQNCSGLVSLTGTANVTTIGNYAFAGCKLLQATPEFTSVTAVGSYAFQDCAGILTTHFSAKLAIVGDYAFSGCASLLTLPECTGIQTLGSHAFENCVSLTELPKLNALTKIEDSTFSGCKALVALPEMAAVETIGNYAFYGCNSLSTFTISSNVTSIGEAAFGNCFKLTEVTLPFTEGHTFYYFFGGSNADSTAVSVTDNTSHVYYVSPLLKTVNVNSATDGKLCNYAFYNASFLTAINLDASLTGIGDYCFANCSGLTAMSIPDAVASIGASSLSGCSSLQKLVVPFAGTSSASNSYLGLIFGQTSYTGGYSANGYYVPSTLTDLTIKDGTLISNACNGMSSVVTLLIGDNVTSIGQNAFKGFTSLTSASLPFCGRSANEASSSSCYGVLSWAFDQTNGDYTSGQVPASLRSVSITAQTAIPSYAFQGCSKITSVTIPATVASIGESAFNGCSSLSRLNSTTDGLFNVPSGVTAIQGWAFYNCSAVTEFTMSDSVASIGQCAFYGCPLVGKFNSDTEGVLAVPSSCASIGSNAFQGMSLISSISVPSTCLSIGQNAFKGFTSLTSASLPFCGRSANEASSSSCYGVLSWAFDQTNGDYTSGQVPASLRSVSITAQTAIPSYAFQGCSKITSVTIPATVASIGESAFNGCSSLSRLNSTTDGLFNVPSGVTAIQGWAFYNCSAVTEFTMSDSVASIGQCAFYGCPLVGKFNSDTEGVLAVPSSCASIGSNAFQGMSLISSISVPSTCLSIGQNAFKGFTSLTSASLPFCGRSANEASSSSCYGVLSWAFDQTNGDYTSGQVPASLRSVSITAQTAIPSYAFQGCSKITSVTIPATVASIGESAFNGCSSLSRLNSTTDGLFNVPSGVTAIQGWAFYNCSAVTEFTMSDSVASIGQCAFYGCPLVGKFNSDTEGVLAVPSSCASIGSNAFQGMSLISSISVPSTCLSIGQNAFKGFTSLTSASLPFCGRSANEASSSSCYGVLSWAFDQTNGDYTSGQVPASLRSVSITAQTAIPSYAFQGCSKITSVTIPATVASIGESAFNGCSSLSRLNSTTDGLFNVPSGVTAIQGWAFYNCSAVTEFTMSDSVASIGQCAFYGCPLVGKFNSDTEGVLAVPSSCASIGSNAFQGMSLISSISVPSTCLSIGQNAFKGFTSLTSASLPFCGRSANEASSSSCYGVLSWAFDQTNGDYTSGQVPASLRSVSITAQTAIPSYAFQGCSKITSVTIPATVASIGESAFNGCSSLSRLNSTTDGLFNVPSGVTAIQGWAFYNCSAVTEFTMSDSVASIGQCAFYGCPLVGKFNSDTEGVLAVPSSCASIGSNAFQGMSLISSISVPSTCLSIGQNAFKGFTSLTSASLPFCGRSANEASSSSCYGVLSWAFDQTNGDYTSGQVPASLRSVSITAQTAIPSYAFQGCSKLTEVHLLAQTTSGTNSFANCTATISYDIPLTEIQTPWNGTAIASSYQSGTGTSSDPYLIYYPSQFVYFIAQVNSGLSYADTYFKLCSNIDLNNKAINPMSVFAGHFIGGGRSVKNFTITGTANPLGLFCTLSGSVDGLGITGFTISGTYDTDASTMVVVGGLAGLCSGTITNCYAVGSITATNKYGLTVGGLVGSLTGTATNCYANVSVSDTSTLNYAYAGGFAGKITGTVTGSFAVGNVSAHGYVQSYSQNGGFVGDLDAAATLTDCYRSSAQSLTRFGVSNSYANELGTSATTADIVSWCKAHWSTSAWNFNATLPTLVRVVAP